MPDSKELHFYLHPDVLSMKKWLKYVEELLSIAHLLLPACETTLTRDGICYRFRSQSPTDFDEFISDEYRHRLMTVEYFLELCQIIHFYRAEQDFPNKITNFPTARHPGSS